MSRPILGVLVSAALSLSAGAQGRPGDHERVAILAELFTSEGCNSCPPADRLLETLSLDQPVDGVYVVAMSEHVTYWDHQGWKDPFGSPRFTERQNMYARRFQLEGAYTPQLVIDGVAQMVGSDTERLKQALADAARAPKPRLVVDAVVTDDELSATASGPGLAAGVAEGADLLWAVTEDHLVVDVKRGENAKRTLRHSGVVRNLTSRKVTAAGDVPLRADRFGGQTSMSASIRLRPDWKREHLRVVAFVQSVKTRRVLSVGWTRLPAAD